jgi:N-acetylmuramoyl-L-alanine amidase
MRTMPETGARWTPQTGAPWVWVNRIEAGWARLALDVEDVAWAKTSDVGWQAQTDVPVPRLAVARLSATTQPHVARLCLPLAQPVPVILQGQPQQLTLRIFGAVSACDFIRQDPQLAAWVDDLRIEQEGPQTVRVTLGFSRSLAGYHHAWEWDAALESQALVVTFRTLPPQPHQWRIGIDPGHGGTEPGGHGPDGTPEKTLNLQLAQRLAQALTAAGCAHVLLSRQQDQTLSLTQRTQWAKNQGLDILLSLHHNALPDGRDPLRVYGSSVFYYQPFARPWAFHLWEAICPISSTPPSGLPEATGPMQRALADAVYFDSLAVTRPSHCLALLIEAGYLTHPWDYERLQSPDYCHRWVQALAGGILAAGGLAKGGKPMPVMLY